MVGSNSAHMLLCFGYTLYYIAMYILFVYPSLWATTVIQKRIITLTSGGTEIRVAVIQRTSITCNAASTVTLNAACTVTLNKETYRRNLVDCRNTGFLLCLLFMLIWKLGLTMEQLLHLLCGLCEMFLSCDVQWLC